MKSEALEASLTALDWTLETHSSKNADALGEIYALGIRNVQRIFWDSKNHNMFMSEIGQNTVEEISPITAEPTLDGIIWEGSGRFVAGRDGGVNVADPRSDAENDLPHRRVRSPRSTFAAQRRGDRLLVVYREKTIPQLTGKLLFGDNPSGEIFYVSADNLPKGDRMRTAAYCLATTARPKRFCN